MGDGADRANPVPVNRSPTLAHQQPRCRNERRQSTGLSANRPSPPRQNSEARIATNLVRSATLGLDDQFQLHAPREVEDQLALHLGRPLQREVDAVEHRGGVDGHGHCESFP